MESEKLPLRDIIIAIPLVFILILFSFSWFFLSIISLIQNISSPVVVFEKGACYMLGVGLGLSPFGLIIIIKYFIKKPITDSLKRLLSRLMISGLALLFIFPHLAHLAIDRHLTQRGYTFCEDATHQWRFYRDIVYIQPSIDCTADLKKTFPTP